MTIRPVVGFPDARLKLVAETVTTFDGELRQLATDLLDTMRAAPGIGITAPHIGISKRVVVLQLTTAEQPLTYVNPVITWASEEMATFEEGCLSVPEIWDDVERPARIKAEYLDLDGKTVKLEADGMLATCLQHEMDHLEGTLFIDHLSRLKRSMALKKLTKAKKLVG